MVKYKQCLLLIVGLSLLISASAQAGRIERVSKSFEAEGAERLVIEADFGMGVIDLSVEDLSEVARFEIEYDKRRLSYDIEYDRRGKTGYLSFETETRRSANHDDIVNEWEVILSSRYPTEMELDIGACEAEIDFGGLPLTELSLDIGAASGEIDFSSRNPERLEHFDLNIGASSVELHNLGNANFEEMDFDCGAASCELDFRGEYKGRSEVRIDVGVGSVEILLPKDIEVRIITDGGGWFSSIDFHNDDLDETRDGIYETENFRGAKDRLIIEVDVGMGSVDFYFK